MRKKEKAGNRKRDGELEDRTGRKIKYKHISTPWVQITSCWSPSCGHLGGDGSPPKNIESNRLIYIWARWECPGTSDTVSYKTLGQLHHFASCAVLWCRIWGTLWGALDGPWHPLSCHSSQCPVDVPFTRWGAWSWGSLCKGGWAFTAPH